MAISRDLMTQLQHALRPLANRIRNSIARSVVRLVDDGTGFQTLQVVVPEPKPSEHYEAYGFTSVPLAGAEGVTLFPNGDRSHAITLVVGDRAHRPTGGEPGQVSQWHYKGARVTMLANGNIELVPGPGGEVLISDVGGSVDRLVKKSEYDGHTHPAGTLTAPGGGGPVTGVSGGAAAVNGTQRLRAQ